MYIHVHVHEKSHDNMYHYRVHNVDQRKNKRNDKCVKNNIYIHVYLNGSSVAHVYTCTYPIVRICPAEC